MGNLSPQGAREADRREAERIKLREDERQEMAAKIAIAVVDRIVADIIRPGPKPEERECYVMAEELRAIKPEIESLVKQVIDVNDGVP